MRGAHHDRHRRHAGFLRKARGFIHIGKIAHLFIRRAAHVAQLALHVHAAFAANLHRLTGDGDIFIQRMRGSIDHDAGAAQPKRAQHLRNARAVIQMHRGGNGQGVDGFANRRRHIGAEFGIHHAGEHLENDGRAGFPRRLRHAHHGFHIVTVKRGNRNALRIRQGENFFQIALHGSAPFNSWNPARRSGSTCRIPEFHECNRRGSPRRGECRGLPPGGAPTYPDR